MTPDDVYTRRQAEQALRKHYRRAAAEVVMTRDWQLSNTLTYNVNPHAHVQPTEDGAFVEVVVWVPRAEAERLRDDV